MGHARRLPSRGAAVTPPSSQFPEGWRVVLRRGGFFLMRLLVLLEHIVFSADGVLPRYSGYPREALFLLRRRGVSMFAAICFQVLVLVGFSHT